MSYELLRSIGTMRTSEQEYEFGLRASYRVTIDLLNIRLLHSVTKLIV